MMAVARKDFRHGVCKIMPKSCVRRDTEQARILVFD